MGRGKKKRGKAKTLQQMLRRVKYHRPQSAKELYSEIMLSMPPMRDPYFLNPLPPRPLLLSEAVYRAQVDICRTSLFAKIRGFNFRPVDFLNSSEMENLLGSMRQVKLQYPITEIAGLVKANMRIIFNLMLQEKDTLTQDENGELEFLGHVRLIYHNNRLSEGVRGVQDATAIAALKVEVLLKVVKAFVFARHKFFGRKRESDVIPSCDQFPEYHLLPSVSHNMTQKTQLGNSSEDRTRRSQRNGTDRQMECTDNTGTEDMRDVSTTEADDSNVGDDKDDDSVIIIVDKSPSEQQSAPRPLSPEQVYPSPQTSNPTKKPGTNHPELEPRGNEIQPTRPGLALGVAVDEWIKILQERGLEA